MTTAARPPALRTTSAIAPTPILPVGQHAHRNAVESLLDSYGAIPRGETVRLAKPTSNLFRPRASVQMPGLDVRGLGGVIAIDPEARTADVQGMCRYEDLVSATLRHGLMPYVVPQLRTITLGGAVTGLGIESTSLRHGLPHGSVLELDVLTGGGEIVTASPDEHADLYRGFPNSYGTLGYATRLRISLEKVHPYVALRHVRFDDPEALADAVSRIAADGSWDGEPVDFVDGTMFGIGEAYLTLGRWADSAESPSDYTGDRIYYRSIRERSTDVLTVHDYLWRWDTDWFWCSRAFGVQNPRVRRIWPRRWRRSDVYHRLVGLENRYGVAARVDAWRGKPPRERVVQDVEIPVERTAEFLRWFAKEVGMSPVWLCPLRVSDGAWPLYPLEPGLVYVNVGFWGTVPIAEGGVDGDLNRMIEAKVAELDGHKSLYSDAYYDEAEFWAAYGGDTYHALKRTYDPDGRLLDLYQKVIQRR
ncbi:MAG: FAD-binding protein [Propionibacteriales bacterium]|nr:FAD-binding protein [Propionibacteriales bacterium]